MRFSTLLKHPADWMTGTAEGTGVVLTSRVRLARNLRLEPFPGWATKERRVSVLERVKPEVEALVEMELMHLIQIILGINISGHNIPLGPVGLLMLVMVV